MLKINSLLLTLALSLFTLFLCETEGDLALKKTTPTHDVKIDHSFNALAITTNNSFPELVSFNAEKEPNFQNQFYAKNILKLVVFENESQYLKVCDFIDLNLTTQSIIYPFHSFL
ncbi:hypothetical protein EV196_101552 [Mariniflexile fucanivorans]|uniref:Uncharacterized protein n=1 Tax=Mariniflexile fucanivorans TaxID=264023 RepID=A0A4R1RSW1_9FLAO|nr:hypothetical protein [Mariniflexile fucanivorans]TCL69120.1 hypothetical protein EV196_101552 [Mariniflexile fucanivorans]